MPEKNNFSESIFGKNLEDLTYGDIELYFEIERQETDRLEFKSYHPSENIESAIVGVTRAISALLNSEGGLVIWGAPKGEKNANKVKIFKGGVCPVNALHEKDWLINKISDNITPLPTGIRLHTITQAANEHLYIFEVQESHYKPHQYQGLYNVRLDGQTKPAPHYLVEALFRQIKFPNIEGYLKFKSYSSPNGVRLKINFNVILFNFSQLQPEESITYYLTCHQGLINSGYSFKSGGAVSVLHYGSPEVASFNLTLEKHQVDSQPRYLEIFFTFKGKNSPVKTCWYKILFADLKKDMSEKPFPKNAIVGYTENLIAYETDEEQGITRADILKRYLER